MAGELSTHGSTELPSLPTSTFTVRERLRLCCKLTFKPRMVKSKGAILVLLWNFVILNTLTFLTHQTHFRNIKLQWLLLAIGFIPALAGWLADVRFGRYKVIKWSIWVMWIALVMATVSSVVGEFTRSYYKIKNYINDLLFFIIAIGLGGYQANIIQFGVDQMNDASTDEIKSFIIWYAMTLINGGIFTRIIFPCLRRHPYKSLEVLFVCVNVTLALILLLCFNHWLIKEPVKENPFKLVYKVIKYAIKNDHPRCRSAFTYCEDELPSRIDFGKSKYGGPFTTEQVEDVKTFCRLLPMVVVGGAVAGGCITATAFEHNFLLQFTSFGSSGTIVTDFIFNSNKSLKQCYFEASYIHILYYSALMFILVYELFMYPILQRCIPRTESLQKVLIGMTLQVLRLLTLIIYDVVSRYNFMHTNGPNATIPCLLSTKNLKENMLKDSLDYNLIALPDFINSVSLVMLCIGAVEFVCAQTPSFMKGLMAGTVYFSMFIFSVAFFVLSIPFKINLPIWSTRTISCEFWYAVLLFIIEICIVFFLTILNVYYKKRRREDLLPNEHFFAERYYSTNY